ncbi:MAG: UvrB/UvrC motif-containing protein [Candidatus Omnitrophica bacterium]|nr:UvrB/UvrC motif-containing protein [Candidatus Omnitrophota bacterium]
MKCDVCHIREATVHLTEVINDKVTKLHLCAQCAKAKGDEMQSHFGLTDLIASLMDFEPAAVGREELKDKCFKCPVCGMTYNDFQKTGKLGCGECYDAFKKDLSVLLRKIHGSDRHIGKMPFRGEKAVKDQETLSRLKAELDRLVQTEAFEKAAVMRDRIKEIENKITGE